MAIPTVNYKSVDDDDDDNGDDDDAADDKFLWLLMFRLSWSCKMSKPTCTLVRDIQASNCRARIAAAAAALVR